MPKLKEKLTEEERMNKAYREIICGKISADSVEAETLANKMKISRATFYRRHKNPGELSLDNFRVLVKTFSLTAEDCAAILGARKSL